jgi:hypothetical protein
MRYFWHIMQNDGVDAIGTGGLIISKAVESFS